MVEEWDTALRRWQVAVMLEESSRAFGPEYQADEDRAMAIYRLRHEHGSPARGAESPAYLAALEEIEQVRAGQQDAIDLAYYEPALEAAQELAKTPAPDVAALRLKIEVIKERELHAYVNTESIFEVVKADAVRLAA